MRTNMHQQTISNFWELFRKHAAELASIDTPDHPVYDNLLAQLQKISPRTLFRVLVRTGSA